MVISNLSDKMMTVRLDNDTAKKVRITCELTEQTPEEVVNTILREELGDVDKIPREIDYSKLLDMLEHDNPEGDDILDNLARLGEEGFD